MALQLETEGTDSEEEVASLEAQISDETDADLWAVDMEIPKDESFDAPSIPEPIESVTEHQEEIMANVPSEQELDYPEPIEDVLPPVEESLSHFPREELENKLRPVIEEFVKEYCRESIEKVAWEIIPDLAENLIKQELARIANSVMDNR